MASSQEMPSYPNLHGLSITQPPNFGTIGPRKPTKRPAQTSSDKACANVGTILTENAAGAILDSASGSTKALTLRLEKDFIVRLSERPSQPQAVATRRPC